MILLEFILAGILFYETKMDCYVRGYVYKVGAEVSFVKNDEASINNCDVKFEVVEDYIYLRSNRYWVSVKVPDYVKGYSSFWYRWGRDRAFFDGKFENLSGVGVIRVG